MMPLGGGALGGVLYCATMEGQPIELGPMSMCAATGAATAFALNYLGQQFGGGMLPSYSQGSQAMTIAYSAAYGFAGSFLLGMIMAQ